MSFCRNATPLYSLWSLVGCGGGRKFVWPGSSVVMSGVCCSTALIASGSNSPPATFSALFFPQSKKQNSPCSRAVQDTSRVQDALEILGSNPSRGIFYSGLPPKKKNGPLGSGLQVVHCARMRISIVRFFLFSFVASNASADIKNDNNSPRTIASTSSH